MHRFSIHRVCALAALLCAGAVAAAQAGGGAAGAWLGLGGGARAAAMGDAFVAVADDASALFYNPAGLDQVPGANAELTYRQPFAAFDDLAYANGVLAYNMSGRGFALGTFAAGVNYFKSWGMPETGGFGPTGRTFSDYEMAMSLGWGKALGGNVVAGEEPSYYFGLAAKIISTKIYTYADGGFGVDGGLLLRPLPPLRLGFGFANVVAPNIELIELRDAYPMTARVGAAYTLAPGVVATAEGRVRKDGDAGAAAGTEIRLGRTLTARAGYRYPEAIPAAGLGVVVGKYSFDFCWRPGGDLGDSYIATAGAAW